MHLGYHWDFHVVMHSVQRLGVSLGLALLDTLGEALGLLFGVSLGLALVDALGLLFGVSLGAALVKTANAAPAIIHVG
jgi:hypothetical protein